MELKRYLKIIQSWWWLVLASFLIVAMAGFAFSFTRQPVYNATTTLIVAPRNSITDVSALRQTLDTLDSPTIINTYVQVLRSQNIYQKALESSGLDAAARPATIQVEAIQNTNLIKINAAGSNPSTVHSMAGAVAENGMKYVNDLYDLYEIKVLDQASMPTLPTSPNVPRDTVLSAVLGLILGITLAFLAEYLKKPLESLDQLSIIDRETNLFNRRYFLQRLNQEMNRVKRTRLPMGMCLIELNPGGDVDAYPRQMLINVRRRVNSYLKRHIRQNEILARWDRDTLAWLLVDTSETAARQGIERLSRVLESKVFEDEETGVTFTFSAVFGAVVVKGEMAERALIDLCEKNLRQARGPEVASIQISQASGSAASAQPEPAGKAA